jgi:hypothetical protein
VDETPCWPRAYDRGVPLVLLIPGHAYSAERPLLHFAGAVFAHHGWSTREIRWPAPPPAREGDELPVWFARQRTFVHAHLGQVLESETNPRIALVGKSMGAWAAGLAADRGLPAIWLTPILRDTDLAADLRRSPAPFLLVGGTADPSWDPSIARDLGRPFHEAENADHGLETADDPVNSAEILRRVTIAMDAFVSTL